MSHLDALITDPGPKRLLSVDGGGIRGLIAIEFLARAENLLRQRFGRSDLVLADYFDYIGGTSTGAIIATLISCGYAVDDIRSFYNTGAKTMFEPANAFQRVARRSKGLFATVMGMLGMLRSTAIFTQMALEKEIKAVLGDDTTLGTEKLRTLLLIVTRNASTDSPWPLSNNPKAKYNLKSGDAAKPSNLDMPLWQLVRASTAAPVFFPAEEIHVPGVKKPFMFVDGGITVYNNPAFQLFLMATLPTYNLRWATGERNMLLVSIGTGLCESANLNLMPNEMNVLYNVQSLPAALMRAATVEQDLLCRVFGKLRPGCSLPELDSEIGNLVGNDAPLSEKLFTYARYNVELSEAGLSTLDLDEKIDPKAVQPLDGTGHLRELQLVGKAAAQRCISIEDFEGFLDPVWLHPSREAPPASQQTVTTSEGVSSV